MQMLLNKRKLRKNCFSILAFWAFLWPKKQPKLNKNEENWQNPNRLMKFSEIWYVNAFKQKKIQQKKLFFDFVIFWPKKQPKLNKNEQNWQNPNRLMKFSEIW